MEVGDYRIDAVLDGSGSVPARDLFPDVTDEQWRAHPWALDGAGRLPLAVGGYLLRGRGRTVLVDLGYGPGALGAVATGGLLNSLAALGVDPDEVTDVLFTHLHRDHVGWASVAGEVSFSRATLHCSPADWAHFVEGGAEPEVAELLRPCRGRVVPLAGTGGLPGVSTRPAPGHTPGCTVVTVSGPGGGLVLLGDVVHCPVQLLEPGWATPFDVDRAGAERTRRGLLAELSGDPSRVLGAGHFPGLRFGRLVQDRGRHRWVGEA